MWKITGGFRFIAPVNCTGIYAVAGVVGVDTCNHPWEVVERNNVADPEVMVVVEYFLPPVEVLKRHLHCFAEPGVLCLILLLPVLVLRFLLFLVTG